MVKICILLTKYVEYVGIYEIQPGESAFNRRNVAVLCIYGQIFISVTVRLVLDTKTIQDFEQCFFVWVTLSATIVAFLGTILKTLHLYQLMEAVNNFIDKYSENPIQRCAYQKAIDQVELLTRATQFLIMKLMITSVVVFTVTLSYYLYFNTDMGPDSFILVDSVKFPFDVRTPIGYAVMFSYMTATFYVICYSVMCALCLIIAIFVLGRVAIKDIQERFKEFNEVRGNLTKMIDWTRQQYEFYSSAKELLGDFNDVMQIIISVVYIWSMLAISDTLLMFISAENVQDLIFPTALFIASFSVIFLFCEIGEQLTDRHMDAYTDFLLVDWYMFPLCVQKIWPTIMAGAQEPVQLTGIGSIACTRQAFHNVCSKAYSYFAAFKQI